MPCRAEPNRAEQNRAGAVTDGGDPAAPAEIAGVSEGSVRGARSRYRPAESPPAGGTGRGAAPGTALSERAARCGAEPSRAEPCQPSRAEPGGAGRCRTEPAPTPGMGTTGSG